ncbi:MAG: hypothetical protein HQL76_17860 [Magnetococcales bacterium]|nr:hypothetical protein [Magnetococcales bacterium]
MHGRNDHKNGIRYHAAEAKVARTGSVGHDNTGLEVKDMNLPGTHSKTAILALFLAAGLFPLAICLWLGIGMFTAATLDDQDRILEGLVAVEKKRFEAHLANTLADAHLLALTVGAVIQPARAIEEEPVAVRTIVAPHHDSVMSPTTPPAPPDGTKDRKHSPAPEPAMASTRTPDTAVPPVPPDHTEDATNKENKPRILNEQIPDQVRQWMRRLQSPVLQLAEEGALGAKFAGLDWIYRQNGRKAEGESWEHFAETFTPRLDAFRKAKMFDNLYLISVKGDVVYSTKRGQELGANVTDAAFEESGLAQLLPKALKQATSLEVTPRDDVTRVPSLLIGAPVRRDKLLIGILAVRLDPSSSLETALAQTAERSEEAVALVGPEGNLRYNNIAWTRLPATLNAMAWSEQSLTGSQGSMIVEKAAHTLYWERFKVDPWTWTLLVAVPTGLPQAQTSRSSDIPQTIVTSTTEPETSPAPHETSPPVGLPPSTPSLPMQVSDVRDAERFFGKEYLAATGYYDLFLIQWDGLIEHTAARQGDHGTSLKDGPYADTNLGRLFERVSRTGKAGLSDIAPYPPSRDEPAAFVAAPIIVQGKVARVVALQRPLERVAALLDPGSELGPRGDVVLVGADFRLRSDSRLRPRTHSITASFRGTVAENGMETEAVRRALAGGQGVLHETLPEAEGIRITAYSPVTMDEETWALVATREVALPLTALLRGENGKRIGWLVGGSSIWILLVASFTWWMLKRPWDIMDRGMMQLARGRLPAPGEPDWESWQGPMEPVRLVMERFYQQTERLHAGLAQLMELHGRMVAIIDGAHEPGSEPSREDRVLEVAVETSDSPEAVLEALARWRNLPSRVVPGSIVGQEGHTLAGELSDPLQQIQGIAGEMALIAVNTASLAARSTIRKASLVEPYQKIRELSETIRHLAGNGVDRVRFWEEQRVMMAQQPKVDDILAALLGRMERMLLFQARALQCREKVVHDEGKDMLAPLVLALGQQAEKLRQIAESLPRK